MPNSFQPAIAIAAIVLALGGAAAAPPDEFSGTLEVVIEDHFKLGLSNTRYFLRSGDGTRYELAFEDAPSMHLFTGSNVIVRGALDKLVIHVAQGQAVVVREASTRAMSNRSAVILLVDFQDATVSCSEQAVAAIMFDGALSVDGLYRESSFDAVSFPRDTDGDGQSDVFRVTIDASIADPCSPNTWADEADSAALAGGIGLSAYQHRVYVLPQTSCTWAGQAHVGCGAYCRTWIDHCSIADIYAHELGHNLGLRHASNDMDNNDVSESAYGDVSDFMGFSGYGWRQVNGPHKYVMGWLPSSQVLDGDQAGTVNYVLSPLEVDPEIALYPQLVKISRPGMGDDLFLSYRRHIGYDTGLGTQYADKTNLHSHDGAGENTLCLGMLDDGQEFNEPSLGLTVHQVAHDDLSVTLQVTLPAADCGGADADGDGVCDSEDVCPGGDDTLDADLDGTPDFCDPCPSGDAALDNDGDGLCDADDTDDDNDGVGDLTDCAPFFRGVSSIAGPIGATLRLEKTTGTELRWNRGDQGHTSNVYRGTIADPWIDASCFVTETLDLFAIDTGTPAVAETFYYLVGSRNICGDSRIGSADPEGDVIPSAPCATQSLESDGDTVPDLADSCPLDADATLADGDGDFVGDPCDNCVGIPNANQENLDGDGAGDACDTCTDQDLDGFGDPGFSANTCPTDNCPAVANPDQADRDGDGQGDVCDRCPDDAPDDSDLDGVCDRYDNCPNVFNPSQLDTDHDGLGDACDG